MKQFKVCYVIWNSECERWKTICGYPHHNLIGWLTSNDSVWITTDVEKVDCKNCLKCLAKKAGLTKDTPAGIIADKLKEMEWASSVVGVPRSKRKSLGL